MQRLFCWLVILAVLVSGCGKGTHPGEEVASCVPYDTKVAVNDKSMTVSWRANCSRLISGYNIYVSNESIVSHYPDEVLPVSIQPINPIPYPGDTDPDDPVQHFVAEHLENGQKYYVSVRLVFPDGSFSKPSNEVLAVCGPRGEMELSIRYKNGNDGFALTQNRYVDADDLENDLYYHSQDGKDYLASPNRLDGFLKENKFQVLPFKGSLAEVAKKLSDSQKKPAEDRIEVKKSDWVHLMTPDSTQALLQVLGFTGSGAERTIKLYYAYSTIAGEAIF